MSKRIDPSAGEVHRCSQTARESLNRASEANWLVKRETSEQTPNSQEGKCAGRQTSREQRLRREWGGEATLQTYCTAGMAKILLKRLGSDLREFLSLSKNGDLCQVIDHLQAAVRAEVVSRPMERKAVDYDEPPLPFMNVLETAISQKTTNATRT